MAQKIKIAAIEVKDGDNAKGHWRNFIFTGDDKAKASMFEPNSAGLKPSELAVGDVIEAEIELKGKFANIKSFAILEHKDLPSKPDIRRSDTKSDDARGESIEAQVAVKVITELRVANALTDQSPEYQVMLAWCRKRLGLIQPPIPLDPPAVKKLSPETPEPLTSPGGEGSSSKTMTTAMLLAWVRERKPALKTDKNVRDYLIASLKVKETSINLDPAGVYAEIKDKIGKEV